jgi:hypothetical protein
MNWRIHLGFLIFFLPLVLIGIGLRPVALAQTSNVPLKTEQVVTNMVQKNFERAQALMSYEGTRIYRLEYHGFPGSRDAEMIVDVKYRSPAMKEFTVRSESGSKLLIEKVFKKLLQSEQEALTGENQKRTALNPENYLFTMIGYENTSDGPVYILSVEPRAKNKFVYRGRIWVDATDFAVRRIEGEPAKNPSFWTKDTKIEQIYTKVSDFWLPAFNRSASTIRLGGRANFSIEYKNYQITAATPLSKANRTIAGR